MLRGHEKDRRLRRSAHARAGIVFAIAAALPSCAALDSWEGFSGAARDAGAETGAHDAATPTSSAEAGADGSASAPITLVQAASVSLDRTRDTVEVPLDEAQTQGDLVVVAIGWYSGGPDPSDVTDSAGNHYAIASPATRLGGSDPIAQVLYYAGGIAAAPPGDVVTVTWSEGVDSPDVRVLEYASLDPSAPLDGASGSSGDGTTPSSGAVTTKFARELVFGAGMTNGSFTLAGDDFALRMITSDANIAEDRVVAQTGSYAAEAPLVPGDGWVMQLATFH